jgi:hypothetical protein
MSNREPVCRQVWTPGHEDSHRFYPGDPRKYLRHCALAVKRFIKKIGIDRLLYSLVIFICAMIFLK